MVNDALHMVLVCECKGTDFAKYGNGRTVICSYTYFYIY